VTSQGFNDTHGFKDSYYLATSHAAPEYPALNGAVDVDLCVIGAGATGLSAAIHAAEAGLSVAVVEGGRVGWGASGRNGGQLIPGLRKGAHELIKLYGHDRAKALFDAALNARATVTGLIERFNIDCDLTLKGHLLGAVKPAHAREFDEEISALQSIGYEHARALSAFEMRDLVEAKYYGGLLDAMGGHYHPLNYTLGLARAATGLGVQIFEHSPAIKITDGQTVLIDTPKGQIRAKRVIAAGDAYLSGLLPEVEARYIPIGSYIGVTEPLSDPQSLIKQGLAVSDTRFVVNYFRLTADGRLLFGGGESYFPEPPHDMASFVRKPLEETFPQLKGIRLDYAWGGKVSVTATRLPHMGQIGGQTGNIYYAHGYSGMGALMATEAGKMLADAIRADEGKLKLFADIAPTAFPGGAHLRTPLQTLGMMWFALRDRV
jgi:gamma-glutamylputrescine oxidase